MARMMKRIGFVLLGAMLAAGPSNPVTLSTEVGSLASRYGKSTVTQQAEITHAEVKQTTILADRSELTNSVIELETASLPNLILVLNAAIEGEGQFAKKLPDVLISAEIDKGKRFVQLRRPSTFESVVIVFDADNARLLSSQLQKAIDVSAWMKSKSESLQN